MASVFVFIRLVEIECKGLGLGIREVIFIEDGFRDNVFFRSPRAEIGDAAAIATEREVRVVRRVSGLLADGAFVFHSENRVLPQRAPRGHRGNGVGSLVEAHGTNLQLSSFGPGNAPVPQDREFLTLRTRKLPWQAIDLAHPRTRRGAPVEMRVRVSAGGAIGTGGIRRAGGRGKISTTRPMRS